jgi:D-alanine-D-alanine ligase
MTLPSNHEQCQQAVRRVPKTARVAVLCGGLSAERDVSLRSGKNCYDALKRLGYENAVLIDVDRTIARRLEDGQIEYVFLALHGQYGEDGCIQGLLEWLGIPYTGNGVLASAITMDKDMTKRLLRESGLSVIPSASCFWREMDEDARQTFCEQVAKDLGFPMMIKPASGGSSVGMAKVERLEDLRPALENAAQFDAKLMAEAFVVGRDMTVGVVELAEGPRVTPILELRSKSASGWYDYEAKYTKGLTEFLLPAPLSDEMTAKIQRQTLAAHQAMGCRGVSRTDFVVCEDGRTFILEINTIPGMTDVSDLPAQARAMGIEYDALVDALLQTAAHA